MSSYETNNLAPRASGKRRRKAYNPDEWASSILSQRTKVLALGVSYPSVKAQIQEGIGSKVNLLHIEESVEQAVELVRRNALTQMDGRDLARVLALESSNDTHCYTVSLESGAVYVPRHTSANFNRPTFCSELKQKYGYDIKFRQVILDYFWIPTGSWQRSHWKSSFFHTTIPNFVREDLLDFNPGLYDETDVDMFSTSGKGGGVVYLPFCLHCVQQILAHINIISKYYTIEFLNKHELDQNALWAATSTIDSKTMQNWLGKALNQEDVYCTITPSEVLGSSIDSNVTKEEIMDLLRRIENFYHVRMIKLKALQMYNPKFVDKGRMSPKKVANNKKKRRKVLGIDRGGFVGLKKSHQVKHGFDQKDTRKNNANVKIETNDVSEEEQDDAEYNEDEENNKVNIVIPIKQENGGYVVCFKQGYSTDSDDDESYEDISGDEETMSKGNDTNDVCEKEIVKSCNGDMIGVDEEYTAKYADFRTKISTKPIFGASAKVAINKDKTFRSISKNESELDDSSKDVKTSLKTEEHRSYKTPDLTSDENTCHNALFGRYCIDAVKNHLEENPACVDENEVRRVFIKHYYEALKFQTYQTTGKYVEVNPKNLPHRLEQKSLSYALGLMEKKKDI